jgi:hypothetical protein
MKHIKLLITAIFIVGIVFFEIERHIYKIVYTFKKSEITRYNLSKFNKPNTTDPIILRPINNNSNWAALILNEEIRTIYFYSQDISENVLNFCLQRNCIKQNNYNTYPIRLSQFQSVYCGVEGAFWKIDDDVLYNSEWLKMLEKENDDKSDCVIIGSKSGGKVSGTLTNVYYFPTGHIYFLNKNAKEILCNNVDKILDEPEDMAVGQILSLNCKKIKFVDIEGEYGHKILNVEGASVIIEKPPNH